MVGDSRDGGGVQPRLRAAYPWSLGCLVSRQIAVRVCVQRAIRQGFLPTSTWSPAEGNGGVSLAPDKVPGLDRIRLWSDR
jgi:hypothetical protein